MLVFCPWIRQSVLIPRPVRQRERRSVVPQNGEPVVGP
jgi:hypothetical protein